MSVEIAHLPPPIAGLNTVSPQLSPDECLRGYNCIPCEYGVRNRSGWKEWVTGLTGAADNAVRTLIPFSGSTEGAGRLFAATSSGIWNVSDSTASPTLALAFPDTTGEAGYGVSTVMVTAAAHFCVYCDEQNGLYVYDERSASWAKVPTGVNAPWTSSTAYEIGDKVTNADTDGTLRVYRCTAAGTSGTGDGPQGTGGLGSGGSAITDGEVTWLYESNHIPNSIGPSLADQHGATVFDTGNMVFPVVFKNRLWLVERATGRAWYLGVNSIYGVATSFNVGTKFAHGGSLQALYDWTGDGGSGPDDRLVAISSGGDVLIYEGTDPDVAGEFALRGVWYLGSTLRGRRIGTDFGGDLLLLSKSGLQSLNQIVIGKAQVDKTAYPSFKVSPIFSTYASQSAGFHGWGLALHPEDSALIITVPVGEGLATKQLVMSQLTKGWYEYPYDSTGVPMFSTATWGGVFYFGTVDGRVCQHSGWLDNVALGTTTGTAVQARHLYGFQNFGNGLQKQVTGIRPTFLSDAGAVGWSAAARYTWDFTELASVAQGSSTTGWDISTWDSGTFAPDYAATQAIVGATGMGVDVAIAVRWAAVSRTIFTGCDVFYEQGGPL